MDIYEIKFLAQKFRKALEKAFPPHNGEKYPFDRFPKECCDDVSDLFGQFLFERNEFVWKAFGKYYPDSGESPYPHVWIKLENGTVVDLTGDQYKDNPTMLNYNNPCYVGQPNQLHQLFLSDEVRYEPYYGIDNYINDIVSKRLWAIYNKVMQYFEEN